MKLVSAYIMLVRKNLALCSKQFLHAIMTNDVCFFLFRRNYFLKFSRQFRIGTCSKKTSEEKDDVSYKYSCKSIK